MFDYFNALNFLTNKIGKIKWKTDECQPQMLQNLLIEEKTFKNLQKNLSDTKDFPPKMRNLSRETKMFTRETTDFRRRTENLKKETKDTNHLLPDLIQKRGFRQKEKAQSLGRKITDRASYPICK